MPVLIRFSQGDVELPEVPSDQLPEVPEASEEKPGLFSHVMSLCDDSDPETAR